MRTDPHLDTGAMALGALPENEAAEYSEHLQSCETCVGELADFLETAAILGSSVAQAPPANLRRAVMEGIGHTAQLPPLTAPDSGGSTAGGNRLGRHRNTDEVEIPAVEGVPSAGEQEKLATVTVLNRPWYRRPQSLLAAAVAVLVLAAGSFFALNRGNSAPQVADSACVAGAADRSVIVPTVGAGGDVTLSPSCDAAVVKMPALPAPPAGKVYQLWVIKGGGATSVKVLDNQAQSGSTTATAEVHAGDTAVGVTLEPSPGSTKPTTKPIWVVPLSA